MDRKNTVDTNMQLAYLSIMEFVNISILEYVSVKYHHSVLQEELGCEL